MYPFIHLHVHSQYSVLDGQASINALVDKAIADGMPAIALTDHGDMYGVKEFFNYVNKKNGKVKDSIKEIQKNIAAAEADGQETTELKAQLAAEQKKIFKPIFGCEMYVTTKGKLTEHIDGKMDRCHLIVLAKNEKGYKNLIKIVSRAWTEGFYKRPRTDKEELASHSEGLIVCSACIGGEIPQLILNGQIEEAEKQVRWFKRVFGDDYYLELQRHKATVPNANHDTIIYQEKVNPVLVELGKKCGVKLICSNDVHFVNEEDAEAHDRLICVSTNHFITDTDRMLYTKQEWMKTQAEMNELFADIPEALSNTMEIYDKVETYSIDHGPIMPNFEIPKEFGTEEEYRKRITEQELFDEFTRDENGNVVLDEKAAQEKIKKLGGYDKLYRIKFEADYLAKLAYDGAKKKYGDPLSDEVRERIKFELHIMKTMGFPGYFLIVQDFITTAREKLGVSVGPGRGSAAGSAVAYCLGITLIDPIKYDLLFERFLNPDRISLPDIDVDFDDDGRADVLRYVTEKYGEDKVAHIITYGTMAAKSAIKDVARVEQLPLSESDRLTKLVPRHMPTDENGKEYKTTLKNCYKYVPEFKPELESSNKIIAETLKYAEQLEGNVRNTGVHACGVIICRDPITDWVPVSTAVDKSMPDAAKQLVTQYEGRVIEETGLIKMDFLGLKTLSIIREALDNIKRTTGQDIDIEAIPIDDKKTFKLYSEGKTIGTFQFESAGMQKYLRELQPTVFEDLIAMNALYRPGPMSYIPDFIARKHGRSPIVYDIPVMEKYLKDTYGITVYQEQVMLLSRLLAGFTRGESDTLRKAMGKKLKDKMDHLKGKFLSGGQANGHDPKVLEKIWADWEKFASYAFNKSHATCYSWVAFQTAYLKANYPAEYMAAVLSRNSSDITKLTEYMDECKSMHIPVKGPDINESISRFGVDSHGAIRFGLSAIKGVGEGVVEQIINIRNKGGNFTSIYDFVERVPSNVCNRKTFESLVLSGAFDCFEDIKREDYYVTNNKNETIIEQLLKYGYLYQEAAKNKEASLFGDDDLSLNTAGRPEIKPAVEWPTITKLEKEKDLVGMYLSAHPLDPYFMELSYGCTHIKDFSEMAPQENLNVTIGGLVTDFKSRISQKGTKYGIAKIEDLTGSFEIRLFGDDYYKFAPYCEIGTPVLVKLSYVRRRNGEFWLQVNSMGLLENSRGKMLTGVTIKADTQDLEGEALNTLNMLADFSKTESKEDTLGNLNILFTNKAINRTLNLTTEIKVPMNKKLVDILNEVSLEFYFEYCK